MKMSRIYQAEQKDARRIHSLMVQVHSQMENPSMYVCDDLEFVRRHMEDEGFILIAAGEQDELLGSLIVRFPKSAEDNLGEELLLSEKMRNQVAHMESAVVAKSARGQGIFVKLMRQAELIAKQKGYTIFMGTVSPDNPASYLSFEKMGYELLKTKEKYGGYLRRIYFSDRRTPLL